MKVILLLLLLFFPLAPQALDKEFDCLVRNVYHESRGEPEKGKIAVALVTLNRVDSGKYPNTICGVVYQKNQFSWTKNYSKVKINAEQWQASKDAAFTAYMNRNVLGHFPAISFHNLNVNPKWEMKFLTQVKNHKFYH